MPNDPHDDWDRRQEERDVRKSISTLEADARVCETRFQNVAEDIAELETKKIDRAEFLPVKALTFGMVGAVLMAAVTKIVSLIFIH